jgi:CubicO group peptidase (beta-lactamase class C family)
MKSISLFFFASTCLWNSLTAQVPDIVKTEGIKTAIQKSNIGHIFFTHRSIPVSAVTEKDLLKSYTLTNNSDLFFMAFFDNSVTNYMHRLSPGLSADSLVKIGNYQFALFIDNKLIYKSNLLPGAPYAKIQDTATTINRPFVNNKGGYGSWSESFWNRFLLNGGDSVLKDGSHMLRMEIRPYIKAGRIIEGELIAAGELSLQVRRNVAIDVSKIVLNKVTPYNDFAVSTDPFNENKIKELKASIDEGIFKKINSVVVIKNGKLLIEEYFNGESRNSLHDPRSVGKSFASTMAGIAIQEKYLRSEDQKLKEFYNLNSFKNYSLPKENAALKDLLTMSSVFDGNDEDGSSPGNEENMYPTDDWVRFTLDLPARPDTVKKEWHYFTAGVMLLGDILNKSVPGGLEKYADVKLFKPLGIINYKWQYTPQHVPSTAGGIQMNALDFAKYGQLYKNEGKWNGKQLVLKEWVRKTFTKHQQIPGRNNEFYGYLFWNKSFSVNNRSYEAFYCSGNGGNYILVFKDQPLVVVITASAYGQPYAHPQVAKMLSKYILPAVMN